MQIRIPEHEKKVGVCYAVTDDGIELPVIDVTHPAFAFDVSDEKFAQLIDQFARSERRRAKLPRFLQNAMLRLFLKRSIIGRGMLEAKNGFLHALPTYLLKLSPETLGKAYSGKMDRRIAAAAPSLAIRLRLRDVAHLLADGIVLALTAKSANVPLYLINIAGGPAADSLNALILIRKERPELLA